MSDPLADDLLLDAVARRQAPGDDQIAALLSALAEHADRPLARGPRRRRSQRHRLFTGLAALTIGASGAGVAAAVGIPDSPPDLPPHVVPSRVEQPAPTLPGATFGLEGPSVWPGTEPILVLTPDGTLVTSYFVPAAWDPALLSQVSAGRAAASEISRSRWSDLATPPRPGTEVAQPLAAEVVDGPGPASPDDRRGDRGGAPVQHRPKATVAKPAQGTSPEGRVNEPTLLRGKSEQAPGQAKPAEAPGKSKQAPGQTKPAEGPGKSEQAPGQAKPAEGPGKSEQAPGQAKPAEAPGKSEQAPGQAKPAEAPGKSEQAPGQAKPAEAPGKSEQAPGQTRPDPAQVTDTTESPTLPTVEAEPTAAPTQPVPETVPAEGAPTAPEDASTPADQD